MNSSSIREPRATSSGPPIAAERQLKTGIQEAPAFEVDQY
jgi:hypothetical protein